LADFVVFEAISSAGAVAAAEAFFTDPGVDDDALLSFLSPTINFACILATKASSSRSSSESLSDEVGASSSSAPSAPSAAEVAGLVDESSRLRFTLASSLVAASAAASGFFCFVYHSRFSSK